MKALITAGGRGTRLHPLTHTSNKHLIPIANKPMILYAVEAVVEAGIRDIFIIVNETKPVVEKLLGDGSKWNARFTYIYQESPLGLAHCLKVAEPFLGKEPFVFYLGDNILAGGINKFVESFQNSKSNCQLLLAQVPDPERFGVAILDKKGCVVRTLEKPKNPKTSYAIAGVYILDHHCFEAFKGEGAVCLSKRGEFEIPDVFQYLLDHGYKISAHNITGWWKDTGKIEDFLGANRLVLEHLKGKIEGSIDSFSRVSGEVVLEKGSKIIKSVIRGPVIIGKDVIVKNSYVGPFTSIDNNCVIENSEVEHSVLMEECKVLDLDVRMDNSLIGKKVVITKENGRPKSYSFLLGDNSKVNLV